MSIEAIALLNDPVRRGLYGYVVSQGRDVGRNEAAEAAGVQRTLAAFHLDKLVEAGLLDAVFRRAAGRGGPGAGRPAKYYRRAAGEFAVSVPPRDYRTAASLLAEVVERAGLDERAEDAARAYGRRHGGDPERLLGERGYEPYEEDGVLRMRNCPFHALAEEFPALVCSMNLALLEGLAEEAGWCARMDPAPGRCCVALSKTNEI